jgi:hypothetical protein
MYLEGADILELKTIGGPIEIPTQLRYRGKVGSLRRRHKLRTVISSIMWRRRGLISAIGNTPV